MARGKKKAAKKTTRKKRRVGSVSGFDVTSLALAGAGAFVANKLNAYLTKDPTKTTMVNIAPYAALGAGVALQMFVKNPMVKSASVGLASVGFLQALKQIAPGLVGEIPLLSPISGTSNRYRKPLRVNNPALNGVGYPLPNSSVYKDSMSVVNGIGSPDGTGSAYAF